MRMVILTVLFLVGTGCSVIITEGDQIRKYGIKDQDALDMLEKIDRTPQEDKRVLWHKERQEQE